MTSMQTEVKTTTQTENSKINKKIKEVKLLINYIPVKKANAHSNISEYDPELRIKNNLFGSMLRKYQNTCMRFQREESNIKNIIETKLVRAAEIAVNQELTEEQRKEVIENPQMVQLMYENRKNIRFNTEENIEQLESDKSDSEDNNFEIRRNTFHKPKKTINNEINLVQNIGDSLKLDFNSMMKKEKEFFLL